MPATAKAPLGEQRGFAIDGYPVLRVTSATPDQTLTSTEDHYLGSRGAFMINRVLAGTLALVARESDEIHWLQSLLAGYKPTSGAVYPWQGVSVDVDAVLNQMNEQDDAVVRSEILIQANGPLPAAQGDASALMTRSTTLTGERLEFDNAGVQQNVVTLTTSGSGWSGTIGTTPVQNPDGAYQQAGMYALAVQVSTASGTSIKKWETPPNCKNVKVTDAMVSSAGVVVISQSDLDEADISGTPIRALTSILLTGAVPDHTGLYSA